MELISEIKQLSRHDGKHHGGQPSQGYGDQRRASCRLEYFYKLPAKHPPVFLTRPHLPSALMTGQVVLSNQAIYNFSVNQAAGTSTITAPNGTTTTSQSIAAQGLWK